VRPEALDALRIDRDNVLTRQFPLLEAAPTGGDLGPSGEAGSQVATLGENESNDPE
jgi:hypothetical protein